MEKSHFRWTSFWGAGHVLLVTTTDVEKQAVLRQFREYVGHEHRLRFGTRKTYYDLGVVGGARVVMSQSEMGYSGPGAAFSTVADACDELHPTAVIAVGIAFGVDSEKQTIGEILISKQVHPYELQRVGTSETGELKIVPRGPVVDASPRLLDRLRAGQTGWEEARITVGLMLSGEKLVDNVDFRTQLHELQPEAIGGEMEAAGVYAAAYERKTDWIVVKAICDWADGKKRVNKKARQARAADNATRFVLRCISLGGLARKPLL